MSKLRSGLGAARPQRAAAGAFGKQRSYLPTPSEVEDERAELMRERRRIRDILSVEYSWDELQIISANMRREMERSEEIAQIFAELSGAMRFDLALIAFDHARRGKRRESRAASKAFDPRSYKRALERVREWYARVKATNPVRYAQLREQSRTRRAEWINQPGKRERHRAVSKAGKRRRRLDPVRGAKLREAEAKRMREYRRTHPKPDKRVRCDDIRAKTLSVARQREVVTPRALVEAIGCAESSARIVLCKLAADGAMRRISHGRYALAA